MYCGEHSLVNDEPDRLTAVSLRCRSWLCPHCCDDRKRALIANAFGGSPNAFLTLTHRASAQADPEAAAAALSAAWRIVRKRALREASRDTRKHPTPYGAAPAQGWKPNAHGPARRRVQLDNGQLPFLAVCEKTVAGWPHLHILLRVKWLDQEWLSAQFAELIDSPNVWIVRLTNRSRRVSYCVKYCGKAAQKFARCKRYWQSRDYDTKGKPTRDDPSKPRPLWRKTEAPLRFIITKWYRAGWEVTFESRDRAFAVRPAERPP